MKNAVRLALLVLCAGLPFSPVLAKSRAKAAAPAPAAVTELQLASELPPGAREALQALIERFNAADTTVHLSLLEPGQTAGAQLMILDEAGEKQLVGSGRYKAVSQVMGEGGFKLGPLKGVPPSVFPRAADKKGGIAGLPVALSTPVLLINQALARKSGLDPADLPRTWGQLQRSAAKLAEAGVACPIAVTRPGTVLLENAIAWQNESFVSGKGDLAINGLMPIRHLALMSGWYKAGLLKFYGHGDEAIEHFAKGECGILLGAQSAYPIAAKAGVDVGVGMMPYYDDMPGGPQNTLADGPALWVAAGKSKAEYKAAARFINFWLQPTQQIEWMRSAGYLPLTRAGVFAASGEALGSELQFITVAVKQLTAKPATASSRATVLGHDASLRALLDEQLDAVWNETKPPKQALDDAVARAARGARR